VVHVQGGGAGMIEVWKAQWWCCNCGAVCELNTLAQCEKCKSEAVCPCTVEKKKEVEADAAKVIPD
jgi:hypothetical protein